MFDAEQYIKAVSPPSFVDPSGRRHDGRVLSMDEWLPLEHELREAGRDWAKQNAAFRKMVDLMFPPRLLDGLRGRTVWQQVNGLPGTGKLRAIWRFAQSQGAAMGATLVPPPGTEKYLGDAPPAGGPPPAS